MGFQFLIFLLLAACAATVCPVSNDGVRLFPLKYPIMLAPSFLVRWNVTHIAALDPATGDTRWSLSPSWLNDSRVHVQLSPNKNHAVLLGLVFDPDSGHVLTDLGGANRFVLSDSGVVGINCTADRLCSAALHVWGSNFTYGPPFAKFNHTRASMMTLSPGSRYFVVAYSYRNETLVFDIETGKQTTMQPYCFFCISTCHVWCAKLWRRPFSEH